MSKNFTHYPIEVDGKIKQFPRVTNFCKSIDNERLIGWAGKVERELCVQAAVGVYDGIESSFTPNTAEFHAALVERIGKEQASRKALEKAANVGSQTHKRIEWKIRKEAGQGVGVEPPLEGSAVETYRKLEAWVDASGLKPLLIEQKVYSMKHEYAGTLDLFAEVPNLAPYRVVVDWKTSRAIYIDAALQVSCYARALEEMGHAGPDPIGALVVLVPKEAGKEGTHLLIPPDKIDYYFQLAMGNKRMWEAQKEWELAAKNERA